MSTGVRTLQDIGRLKRVVSASIVGSSCYSEIASGRVGEIGANQASRMDVSLVNVLRLFFLPGIALWQKTKTVAFARRRITRPFERKQKRRPPTAQEAKTAVKTARRKRKRRTRKAGRVRRRRCRC